MNFEFNELSRRLDTATDLIASARYHAVLWIESRALARQVWNDSCSQDMDSHYLTPLSQKWEMADLSVRKVTEDLKEVLAQFNMFQRSAEGHAQAAASISTAEEEFKSHCNHLESLRDSFEYSFRECARFRDESADLLRQAQEVCSRVGI
jgi:hypothetical protein